MLEDMCATVLKLVQPGHESCIWKISRVLNNWVSVSKTDFLQNITSLQPTVTTASQPWGVFMRQQIVFICNFARLQCFLWIYGVIQLVKHIVVMCLSLRLTKLLATYSACSCSQFWWRYEQDHWSSVRPSYSGWIKLLLQTQHDMFSCLFVCDQDNCQYRTYLNPVCPSDIEHNDHSHIDNYPNDNGQVEGQKWDVIGEKGQDNAGNWVNCWWRIMTHDTSTDLRDGHCNCCDPTWDTKG